MLLTERLQMAMKTSIPVLHQNFIKEFMQAAMLNSSKISAIPTFMFLIFSFVLIYGLLHRRTTHRTRFRLRLYRDFGFHWTYFYVTKIWFLLVRGVKYGMQLVEAHLEAYFVERKRFYLHSNFIRGIAFSLLLSVAVIPLVLLFIKLFYKQNVPNFLMWIPEDPWLGSEIGVAGHYLDRPPRFLIPNNYKKKMKTRRAGIRKSFSVDEINENIKQKLIARNCRSMEQCNFLTT